MIVDNLPLVGFLVTDVWRRATHLSRDDLAAAGALALVTAADAYDPTRGVPFGAFARRRILGAFADEMRAMDWATRGARERIKSVTQTQEALTGGLGRAATIDEVAEAMGVPRDTVTEGLADAARTVESLDETVTDRLTAEIEAPGDRLLDDERIRHLTAAVESLPERHREIIRRVYLQGEPVSDVAKGLGITHSAVSQQRSAAIRMLRLGFDAHYGDQGDDEISPVGAGGGAAISRQGTEFLERMSRHPLLEATQRRDLGRRDLGRRDEARLVS